LKKPKILLYDVENTPNTGYTWGTFQQNVIKVIKPWELLCFSYKWLGDKTVRCVRRKPGEKTDRSVVTALRDLMSEADIVVAHNAIMSDNKKATTRFTAHRLTPPAPFKTIDTLQVARRYHNFPGNSLRELAEFFGLKGKAPNSGFPTWEGCMADEPWAWREMTTYNKQDTALLEEIYLLLRPSIENHPNVAIRGYLSCTTCGSFRLQSRGTADTTTGTFGRVQCQDCGGWSRYATGLKHVPKQLMRRCK